MWRGLCLHYVCEDMKGRGIDTLYLITITHLYERYGWEFLCMIGNVRCRMTNVYSQIKGMERDKMYLRKYQIGRSSKEFDRVIIVPSTHNAKDYTKAAEGVGDGRSILRSGIILFWNITHQSL